MKIYWHPIKSPYYKILHKLSCMINNFRIAQEIFEKDKGTACELLGVIPDNIAIKYCEDSRHPLDFPMCISISPDEIDVSITRLKAKLDFGDLLVNRILIYQGVCYIVQKKSNPNLNENELKLETLVFAYACLMVMGNSLPNQSYKDFSHKVEHCANRFFNIVCRWEYDSERSNESQVPLFKLVLTHLGRFEYWCKFNNTVKVNIDEPKNKGTEENPFENILEACEYITNIEEEAYRQDSFLNAVIADYKYCYDTIADRFRYPFDSSYTSFYQNNFPEDSFIVNRVANREDVNLIRYSLKPNLYKRKFLYRGQNNYYENCTPGLFRDANQDYFLEEMLLCQEQMLMTQTHPLVRLLDQGVELNNRRFVFETNYGGLNQHYYNKTKFLDLTSDLEAAKFFAVTKYENQIYSPYDKEGVGVLYYYDLRMPEAFHDHKGYSLSTIGKQVFMRSGSQHGFLLSMERGVNFNRIPEVHKVFFRHNYKISKTIFDANNQGKVFFPNDALEMAWKRKMDEQKVQKRISLDAVRYNITINKGETIESIEQKLRKYDMVIDRGYKPKFTAEEIDLYYDAVRNDDFWEKFAENIYFYGNDGELFMQDLMHLPERKQYKWAFYR